MTSGRWGVLSTPLDFSRALAVAALFHVALMLCAQLIARGRLDPAADVDHWVGDWLELSGVLLAPEPASAAEVGPRSPEPESRAKPTTRARAPRPADDWLSIADQLPADRSPKPAPKHPSSSALDKASVDAFSFRPRVSSSGDEAEDQDTEPAVDKTDTARAKEGALGGSEGTAGVRRLAVAFTRAIPVATDSDPAWRRLPVGRAGELDVTLQVDERGTITDYELHAQPAPQMKHLLELTLRYLERGRFALSPEGLRAGKQRFKIEVTLSERALTHAPRVGAKPESRFVYGHEPPTPSRPGKAWFQYVSGRYFEATVKLK